MRTYSYIIRLTVDDPTDRDEKTVAQSVAAALEHSTAREALEEATQADYILLEMLPGR